MLTLHKFALSNKINLFGLMATLFIGQNKVFLPETDSTNSYATSLLKNVNCIEGTVVYTNKQTNGKGQRGNSWLSDPSMNITLSVILKPAFLRGTNVFYLSKITALALYDLLTDILTGSQFDIKIKWPNDILVNNRKIAGILIENNITEDRINWSVIGIGLNVNQTVFNGMVACSVKTITGKEILPEELSLQLFEKIEKWYLLLRNNHIETINLTYHQHLLGYKKSIRFMHRNVLFSGCIAGVEENGRIRIIQENNEELTFEIKEISFIL